VWGAAATANSIRLNSIHANGGKGIENINGGNGEPGHAPPLITAGDFSGASGTACSGCAIEIFSDTSEDEGRVHHGTVTADGAGNWSFTGAITGPKLTATATNPAGSTSEFGSFLGTPQPGPDYTVNSTGPEDDGGCHEGFGDCTLREAINAANSNPTPSTLELAVGPTFTLTQVDNGANGLPVITTNMRINGHEATIRRDPDGPRFRLFQVGPTGDLVLEDLTLTQGHPPDGTAGGGGAIYSTGGAITLVRSEVSGNRAGAGITNVSGGHGNHGGGVYMNGGFLVVDTSTVNGNIAGNGAPGTGAGGAINGGNGGNGGGVAIYDAGFQIVGSTINSNFAGFAGYAQTAIGSGGQGGQGGGIFINNASFANIGNTTIVANTAGSGGGGGQVSGLGGGGGGIRAQSFNLALSHVTFSGNNAGAGGPGAANGSGGGINDSPGYGVTVKNTLMVAATIGTNCAAVINAGSGGNISTDSSCGTTYFVQRTPAQINLAAALAENGGPTRTLALTPPSAAVDTALDPACSGDPIYYRDQRGEMRFSDGDGIGGPQCDVGAYEYCPDIDDDDVCLSQDNCPAWTNQDQTLPPWPVPANDPDCDGWNNAGETHVGTDPAKRCNNDSTLNNEPDAWPTDFNDSRFTNLADVSSFNPTYNKLQNDDGYSQRHDLNASNSVTLSDVSLMNNFYNKSCG